MASVFHRYRGISRLWQVTSACVGMVLMLVLVLHAPPALAQQPEVAIFEAAIFDQETGDQIAQDCLRFSLDGFFLFRSDVFFGFGFLDGRWNIASGAEGSVLTAFTNT